MSKTWDDVQVGFTDMIYLFAALLFILGLAGLSHPQSAKRGTVSSLSFTRSIVLCEIVRFFVVCFQKIEKIKSRKSLWHAWNVDWNRDHNLF